MTRPGKLAPALAAVLATLAFGMAARAQGTGQPAELPPAGYAGQQYVDSQGCVFLRAGAETGKSWVPRVTSGGKQICGYPPSGKRVPIFGEAGADAGGVAAPMATDTPAVKAEPGKAATATASTEALDEAGTFVVAVGSFGFPSNVRKATAAAEGLGYSVETGQLAGGEQGLVTVFAGPFGRKSAALAALEKLQGAGYPDAFLLRR